MTSLIFLAYAIAHLALFGWALSLFLRCRQPSTVPLLIVTFGLIYDNAMLAVGSAIGHGQLLEQLSVPRFFMHAFGTPLLILTALGQVRRTGSVWAGRAGIVVLATGLTLAMIAVGVFADLLMLDLEPKRAADVVSYGNAATDGPPVAPLVTIIVLITAGLIVWRGGGGPWLLAGSLSQFVAAAVGDAILIAGNLGELALLAGLLATERRLTPAATSAASGSPLAPRPSSPAPEAP